MMSKQRKRQRCNNFCHLKKAKFDFLSCPVICVESMRVNAGFFVHNLGVALVRLPRAVICSWVLLMWGEGVGVGMPLLLVTFDLYHTLAPGPLVAIVSNVQLKKNLSVCETLVIVWGRVALPTQKVVCVMDVIVLLLRNFIVLWRWPCLWWWWVKFSKNGHPWVLAPRSFWSLEYIT